jgi:hypothetical protein
MWSDQSHDDYELVAFRHVHAFCHVHADITVRIELQSGSTQAWEDFAANLPQYNLRHFSPYIHIYAPTIRLKFRTSLEDSTRTSSPLSAARKYTFFGNGWRRDTQDKPEVFSLQLTRRVDCGDLVHASLLNGTCECILFPGPRVNIGQTLDWLVVCYHGEVAERVGIVDCLVTGQEVSIEEESGPDHDGKAGDLIYDADTGSILSHKVTWKTIRLG